MQRFAAFEDSALQARLARLERAEADLDERIRRRIEQAEAEARWAPSDPVYQRLVSVLRKVRAELRETQAEQSRRTQAPAADAVAAL
jgi:hypothetical protein